MSSNNDSKGTLVIVILMLCVIFYFIFKMFILVGIGLAILGIVGLLLGLYMQEEVIMIGSLILLVIGLVLFLIGHGGVGFFESNDIGQSLLGGG